MTTLTRHAWAALLAAQLICAAAYATGPKPIAFEAVPGQPIISLTRVHGMVRGVEDAPLVRVYADGLVRVDVPVYMKNAGHYEYRLDGAALQELLQSMDAQGVMSFDKAASQARHADAVAAQRAAGLRFATLDSTVTRIEINFARYGLVGDSGKTLRESIEWADVGVEAERFPQLDDLAGLARAEKMLLTLIDDPRRQLINTATGE